MPEKFNPDSFAPFLETIRRSESKTAPATPLPVAILHILAAQGSPMPVATLLTASGLPMDEFANALRGLEVAALIVTRVESGNQVVSLTPIGEQVAAVKV